MRQSRNAEKPSMSGTLILKRRPSDRVITDEPPRLTETFRPNNVSCCCCETQRRVTGDLKGLFFYEDICEVREQLRELIVTHEAPCKH